MTWRVWQVSPPFHQSIPSTSSLGPKVELAQFHSQWILKSQQQQKQMVPPMTVGFVKGEGWVTTVSCATIMYYINHMLTFDGNHTSCVTATCVWLEECCCCRRIAFGGLAKRQTFHSNYVRGLGRMFHNQGSTIDNGIPKILQLHKLQRFILEKSNMRIGSCLPFESCTCLHQRCLQVSTTRYKLWNIIPLNLLLGPECCRIF